MRTTGEDLWMQWNDATDPSRSPDNDNMANVVHPDQIHTKQIITKYNIPICDSKVITYSKQVPTYESMQFGCSQSILLP